MAQEQHFDSEERFSDDKKTPDEIKLNKELSNLLNNERLAKYLDALHEVNKSWPKQKSHPTISLYARIALSIAASLIIIVFARQFYLSTMANPTDAQLFAAYFEPYQMLLSQRSANDTTGQAALFNKAVNEYAKGNFSSAAAAFQQLGEIEQDNISFKFYCAMALMGSGKAKEASGILEKILHTGGHLFAEQSRWYLSLAYILAGEEAKASQQLQSIKPGAFYYNKSLELLAELE